MKKAHEQYLILVAAAMPSFLEIVVRPIASVMIVHPHSSSRLAKTARFVLIQLAQSLGSWFAGSPSTVLTTMKEVLIWRHWLNAMFTSLTRSFGPFSLTGEADT
jgi:ABC-type enterobactin transport system permease subunit